MTPRQADALAQHSGGYVSAAALLADIADAFSGTGEAYFNTLAEAYRTQSLAMLARACEQMTPTLARMQ